MGQKKLLITQIFTDFRLFIILILGMVSGMPMGFFIGMLTAWLKDLNIAITAIGIFALARSPYAYKFFWAPIVDHFKLPILFNLLGRRRSWMLLANIIIIATILAIGFSDPITNIKTTFALTFLLGFCAATYDIAFDAFRIETVEDNLQAIGAASTVLGYRLGMSSVSLGSLLIADHYSWEVAYIYVAILFSIGTLFILISREPNSILTNFQGINTDTIKKTIIDPFLDFIKRDYAITILLAIALYKLGEAMLSSISTPFYLEVGFTKTQIAGISKAYGVIATLSGVFIGGIITAKIGNIRSLIFCGTCQMLSNLMFVWQNHMGADPWALMLTLSVENVTGGMGNAALVGYISALCNKKYTATHYALLSSCCTFANDTLTASSGYFVKYLGWDNFFIFTTIISLPSLLIIFYLNKKLNDEKFIIT